RRAPGDWGSSQGECVTRTGCCGAMAFSTGRRRTHDDQRHLDCDWAAIRSLGHNERVSGASGAALDKAAWAETSEPPSLESIKSSLDEIESSVGSDEIPAEALAGFRQTLNTATEALRAKIDELEPRTHDAEERLKQLGPAPAKDAPPESADIANEREELTKQFSEL